MTTTTFDPAISDPPVACPVDAPGNGVPLAVRLLSHAADDRPGNAARLGLGFLGLSALGSVPGAAVCLASPVAWSVGAAEWIATALLDALSLPVAAALTLTLALPGLAILLGMFDLNPSPHALLNAVARAFHRMGLLSLGATPTLALYAATGATSVWIHVGTALGYVGIGALSLGVLSRELLEAIPKRRGLGGPLVFAWTAFVGLFGLHLFQRLNVEPWL